MDKTSWAPIPPLTLWHFKCISVFKCPFDSPLISSSRGKHPIINIVFQLHSNHWKISWTISGCAVGWLLLLFLGDYVALMRVRCGSVHIRSHPPVAVRKLPGGALVVSFLGATLRGIQQGRGTTYSIFEGSFFNDPQKQAPGARNGGSDMGIPPQFFASRFHRQELISSSKLQCVLKESSLKKSSLKERWVQGLD